jgi:hypothetical protein
VTPLHAFVAQLASIAAIQVLVGWWLKSRLEQSVKHEYDRRLEQFKSTETISIEIAKLRVVALAEVWAKISAFEAECWAQSKGLASRMLIEARRQGVAGIPEELPFGHKEVFDVLTKFMDVKIPDARMAEIEEQAAPERQKLTNASDELNAMLTANRFWIGSDLDEELREYSEAVRVAFMTLGPGQEDRREFVRLLRVVRAKRWDVREFASRLEATWSKERGAAI